jgi:hypothetical protein
VSKHVEGRFDTFRHAKPSTRPTATRDGDTSATGEAYEDRRQVDLTIILRRKPRVTTLNNAAVKTTTMLGNLAIVGLLGLTVLGSFWSVL